MAGNNGCGTAPFSAVGRSASPSIPGLHARSEARRVGRCGRRVRASGQPSSPPRSRRRCRAGGSAGWRRARCRGQKSSDVVDLAMPVGPWRRNRLTRRRLDLSLRYDLAPNENEQHHGHCDDDRADDDADDREPAHFDSMRRRPCRRNTGRSFRRSRPSRSTAAVPRRVGAHNLRVAPCALMRTRRLRIMLNLHGPRRFTSSRIMAGHGADRAALPGLSVSCAVHCFADGAAGP